MPTWAEILFPSRGRRQEETLKTDKGVPSLTESHSPPPSAALHPPTISGSIATKGDPAVATPPFMRLPTEIRQQILLLAAGECKLDYIETASMRDSDRRYAVKHLSYSHMLLWQDFRYLSQINRRIGDEMEWVQKKWLDVGMGFDEFIECSEWPNLLRWRRRTRMAESPDIVINLGKDQRPVEPLVIPPWKCLPWEEHDEVRSCSDLWLWAVEQSEQFWQDIPLDGTIVPRLEIRATGLNPVFKSHYELLAQGLIEIAAMVSNRKLRYKVMWRHKILTQSQVSEEHEEHCEGGYIQFSAPRFACERDRSREEWIGDRCREISGSIDQELARIEREKLRMNIECERLRRIQIKAQS